MSGDCRGRLPAPSMACGPGYEARSLTSGRPRPPTEPRGRRSARDPASAKKGYLTACVSCHAAIRENAPFVQSDGPDGVVDLSKLAVSLVGLAGRPPSAGTLLSKTSLLLNNVTRPTKRRGCRVASDPHCPPAFLPDLSWSAPPLTLHPLSVSPLVGLPGARRPYRRLTFIRRTGCKARHTPLHFPGVAPP